MEPVPRGSAVAGPLSVAISGPSGLLCTLHACKSWSLRELKHAIQDDQGISYRQQRLIYGLRELSDADLLGELCADEPPDVPLDLTLVRRSLEQVEWLRLAEEDWSELLNQPGEVWSDREVVLRAVASSVWALQHAAEELRADRAVVEKAVKQNGLALKFAAAELTADVEVALAAVSQCGRAFQYCSDLLQADRNFILSAVGANGHSLKYVSEQLQDEEIVRTAVDQCGNTLGDILDNSASGPSVKRRIRHVLQNKGVLGFEEDSTAALDKMQSMTIYSKGSDQTCFFGRGGSDGHLGLVKVLGWQAAQLCELANLGLPVPPGFCLKAGPEPWELWPWAKAALNQVEAAMQQEFANPDAPLLLSVRNAQQEVSSIGLSDEIAQHLAARQNPNCVWDSYRRLIVSYAQVVHNLDSAPFERELEKVTEALNARDWLGRKHDVWQIPTNDLQQLVETYKDIYQHQTGDVFPQDPTVQLQKAMEAVHGKSISDSGAAIVQAMVFGNYDFHSGAGKLMLQNSDGTPCDFSGTWLPKAQREDISAQKRPDQQLTLQASQKWAEAEGIAEGTRSSEFPSLEECLLPVCAGLAHCKDVLARAGHDIQAVEFVVQQGRLWLLQPSTNSAKTLQEAALPSAPPVTLEPLPGGPVEEVELTTYTTWDEADIAGPSPELSAAVEPPVEPQLDFWGFPKDVPGVRSFRTGWKPRLVQKGRATDQPACRPLPEMRESQQSTGLAFGLALPLWQTAVAGGFACVAHRTVAASVADLMGCPTRKPAIQELARQAVPTVARNATKFSAGFPFGAICCSLYVNILHFSATSSGKETSDNLDPMSRFSCASAAVTLATVATYPLALPTFGHDKSLTIRSAATALRAHGCRAVASANPVAAVEMCAIDVVRNAGNSAGLQTSAGLLFASGCAAGCFAQSLVHLHETARQPPQNPPPTRRERLQGLCRSLGPQLLKHAPAVGVNSLVRVGLVTHFLSQQ